MGFFCFAAKDIATGGGGRASLENNGPKNLLPDRGLATGQSFAPPANEAMREAELFLLILTQRSNRSPEVRQRLESAAHFQLPVVTFRIEPVEPADELSYFLWEKHFVDGFGGPPIEHIPSLVRQIKTLAKPEEQGPTGSELLTSSGPAHSASSGQAETFANFRMLGKPDGALYRLGQGGMGVTYKAIDTTLDRPVALKLIAADLLKSSKARQRFLREAKAAAKIVHPNVATVFQFGEEGDAYFYAMEFLEGEDLERFIDHHGALSPRVALVVTRQIAQALEAAQSHQLIHRDIKPGNIMTRVNRFGELEVKLIDFGLARLTDPTESDAGQITHSQDFVGSPAFASPEQCEMHGSLDTRSDIYSLGVTLWYLLLARLPFTGTVGQLLVAHSVKPPPWSELENSPVPVVDLLRRMLAKDPNERPQTPAELQEAIEQVISVLTNPPTAGTTSQVPSTSSGQVPSTSSGQVPSTSSGQVPSTSSGQVPSTSSGQVPSTSSGQGRSTSSGLQPAAELTFVPDHSASSGQAHSASSGQATSPASGQVRPGTSKAMTPSQSEGYWQGGVGAVLAEGYWVTAERRAGIGGPVFL